MFKHIAEINSATTVGTTLCAECIAYSCFHPQFGNAKNPVHPACRGEAFSEDWSILSVIKGNIMKENMIFTKSAES